MRVTRASGTHDQGRCAKGAMVALAAIRAILAAGAKSRCRSRRTPHPAVITAAPGTTSNATAHSAGLSAVVHPSDKIDLRGHWTAVS